MKPKHLQARIAACLALAECSGCLRRKFAAVALDPHTKVVLVDSYNGGPRGGSIGCGPDFTHTSATCAREAARARGEDLPPGAWGPNAPGCHHAEANLVCNAARLGVKLNHSVVILLGEPCLTCAKLLHHTGIAHIYIVKGGYDSARPNGVAYLIEHNVGVEFVDGPKDPRSPG